MSILTIGINPAIDRVLECADFHVGGHQQVHEVARLAAGKAVNVSRAIAQLGADSIATGFIGTSELEYFHQQLLECGPGRVLCHFIEVGGATRENITILDTKRRIETHLRDRGFAVVEGEIDLLEKKLRHDLREGDIAVFSGSLCEGLSPERFGTLVEIARSTGAMVAVDTSGEALAAAVTRKLWLIKPNLAELSEVLHASVENIPAAIAQAASPLLSTIENILISRGADGAVLVTRDATWSASIQTGPDAVVRTVGCGDHLLGGFVAESAQSRGIQDALRTAVAVATARALSPTLDAIDPNEVRRLSTQVQLVKIR